MLLLKMHEIEYIMYRNDQEGIPSHEKHRNSSSTALAYPLQKVAIALLRFPPRVSNESPFPDSIKN